MAIKPKADDEVKFRVHGYVYAKPEERFKIAEALTMAFRQLAGDGVCHNVLLAVTIMIEENPIPIFENEEDQPEFINSETRLRRLMELEEIREYERSARDECVD